MFFSSRSSWKWRRRLRPHLVLTFGVLSLAMTAFLTLADPSPTTLYDVGIVELRLGASAPTNGKTLVWYPVDQGSNDPNTGVRYPYLALTYQIAQTRLSKTFPELLNYHGQAYRNAVPPAGLRFPLVLLSHDLCMQPAYYSFIAEYLASHGFVVVAPAHADSSALYLDNAELGGCLDPSSRSNAWYTQYYKALWTRPLEMIAAINRLLPASQQAGDPKWLKTLVDTGLSVTVVGHGLGAVAAMYLGGVPTPKCPDGILPVDPVPANQTAIVTDVCSWLDTNYGEGPYLFQDTRTEALMLYDPTFMPTDETGLVDFSRFFTKPFWYTVNNVQPYLEWNNKRYDQVHTEHVALPKSMQEVRGTSHQLFTDFCDYPPEIRGIAELRPFFGSDLSYCNWSPSPSNVLLNVVKPVTLRWLQLFVYDDIPLARTLAVPDTYEPAEYVAGARSEAVAELDTVTTINWKVAFIATSICSACIIACLTFFIACCSNKDPSGHLTIADDEKVPPPIVETPRGSAERDRDEPLNAEGGERSAADGTITGGGLKVGGRPEEV